MDYKKIRVSFSFTRPKSDESAELQPRRRYFGTRKNTQPGKCLAVFRLSEQTSEQTLFAACSQYGTVEKVEIPLDHETKMSRRYGFVYFEKIEVSFTNFFLYQC
jgi:RNA recognition motif-containing protein